MGVASVLCLFLSLWPLSGQSYLVHTYTSADGLPISDTKDITQDHSGRIWAATARGVAVYDGLEWKSVHINGKVANYGANRILTDEHGDIWVICYAPEISIYRFRKGSWKELPAPPILRADQYFISTFEVFYVDNHAIATIGTLHQGLLVWNEVEWRRFGATAGISPHVVKGVAAWKDRLLIVTPGGGYIFDGSAVRPFPPRWQLSGENLSGIAIEPPDLIKPYELSDCKIWIHGQNWIGVIKDGQFEKLANSSFKSNRRVEMLPDFLSGVLLNSDKELHYYNTASGDYKVYDVSTGLIASRVSAMFVDREKNIWLCGHRGISKIASRRFGNYRSENGLYEDATTAIMADLPGNIWFGHTSGLSILNGDKFEHIALPQGRYSDDRFNRILGVAKDETGTVWAAASSYGLVRIGPQNDVQVIDVRETAGYISSVLVYNGEVLVGSVLGLFRADRNGLQRIDMGDMATVYVRSLEHGPSNELILGTYDRGLLIHEHGEWRSARASDGPRSNNVFTIYTDGDDSTWVGTEAGLYKLGHDTLIHYEINGAPLLDRPVFSIIQDRALNFWFGTGKGIGRWDRHDLRWYTEKDGLAGMEANRSALAIDHTGKLWIGTGQGVSSYEAGFDQIRSVPPPVEILRVMVNGQQFAAARPVRLAANKNNLTFYYRAISYVDEKSIRFEFRLNGFEAEYSDASFADRGERRYTNLPPGSYSFEVRARNSDEEWGDWARTSEFLIEIPFWQRGWFLLIACIAIGLIIYAISSYFSKERYLHQLEKDFRLKGRALLASEEKYRTLFEQMQDAMFISTADGQFIDINRAGVKLFGYASRGALLEKRFDIKFWFNSDDRKRIQTRLDESGFIDNEEVVLCRKDGTPISVLYSAQCVTAADGGIIGYRGFIRDITEHKKLEKQFFLAQKMESIGLLAGGIAHDFNNILSGILGYASLLKMDLLEQFQQYQYADIIENSTHRAAELTSQLLGFARGGKYDIRPLGLNRLIKETLTIVRRTIDRSIEIKLELADELPCVEADATQLRQVILNLCVNARDAMPAGGIMHISTTEIPAERLHLARGETGVNRFIQLTVADSGCGIDPKSMERIFEPFFTTKEKGKGTGLGLAMVYGVVKNHEGYLHVESEPGKGTTFYIYLPASMLEEEEMVPELPEAKSGTETILVVDDEEIVRALLCDALDRAGYTVLEAQNGEQALAIYQTSGVKIDLVILDLIMPKKGGHATLKELLIINPEVKALIATGYSDTSLQGVPSEAVSGILHKPFRPNDMLFMVRQALDSKLISADDDL